MLQGECVLDAEDIVKLFTIDQVDQHKSEEWVYKVALQVSTSCVALRSTVWQQLRQAMNAAAVRRGCAPCWSITLQLKQHQQMGQQQHASRWQTCRTGCAPCDGAFRGRQPVEAAFTTYLVSLERLHDCW